MKLRLRSLESNQTHKIEVPNSCNLQQLKEKITLELFPSSSSSIDHKKQQSSLLLSLNRKEELCGPSPDVDVSLQSLGVTSGDLIYFTENPYAFSNQNPNLLQVESGKSHEIGSCNDKGVDLNSAHVVNCGKIDEFNACSVENSDLNDAHMCEMSNLRNNSDFGSAQMVESCKGDELSVSSSKNRGLMDAQVDGSDCTSDLGRAQIVESCKGDELSGSSSKTLGLMDVQVDGSDCTGDLGSAHIVESSKDDEMIGLGSQTRVLMDAIVSSEGVDDEMEVDDESELKGGYKFSVPGFLKKVFVKEVGDSSANGGDHKLLVIAVHAVLLESGFVGYDPVSGKKVDGFHLDEEWPSLAFGMTLHYTLPEVSTSEVVETVVLKFQTLGKFVKIYGLLPKKGFGVHQVCLDELRFLPALSFIWKWSDDNIGSHSELNESGKLYPNQEIFEFWKIVKDGLSYPLLIDLCERVGLVPPPCFMRLPTELKLKILESLPAVNVARVESVCSELRFIASNNDLWKLKYEEEFGNATVSQSACQWKAKFSSAWEIRKKRKRACRPYHWRDPFQRFRPSFPGRRDPNPFGSPFIIGGDHDRLPALGLPQYPGRRIFFRSNCDLGGLGL